MIRTLLIITGASLVLCVAALGGAAALGGHDFARHGWTWTLQDEDGDRIRFEREFGDAGPETSRTLAWPGGVRLAIDVPGEVTYVQGDEAGIVVSGPEKLVQRLRLADGDRLTFEDADGFEERVTFRWGPDGLSGWSDADRLKIRVTAPGVRIFEMSGSSRLFVRNYDQPHLAVILSGSGEADVQGRTETVTLDISGSGEADLSKLETRDADVDISGSGEAAVGPTGTARIDIAGSGSVDLTTRPASVTQSITGSGEVNQR